MSRQQKSIVSDRYSKKVWHTIGKQLDNPLILRCALEPQLKAEPLDFKSISQVETEEGETDEYNEELTDKDKDSSESDLTSDPYM